MNKMKLMLMLIMLHFAVTESTAQRSCTVQNKTFSAGESCSYKILYNWGAIWMEAGEATFSTSLETINGKPAYHFTGTGATYSKYDWFYKVRDKYESWADTLTLKPLRFRRDAHEGGNHTFDDYVFDQKKKKVFTSEKRGKKPSRLDSINITSCTNDVMTAIFYARCLDFSSYKSNDTIPITFVLDGKVYPSYVRYLGKETIKNDVLGTVRCIKFRPKLIEGTLFKGGEGMTVWVTDDMNRMPVYVETPIVVGTVKVHLFKYSGLRNKIEAIVK
jgi:hypothetical protein